MPLPVSNAINTAPCLGQRVACNRSAPGSFRRFVQRLLAVRADDHALELGVGLGEQFLSVATKARLVVGVDISTELVEAVRARLQDPNCRVILGDMDELAALALPGPFTLAYSVYSIYYSRDPARLVRTLHGMLAGPKARCVVVAPDLGNNAAWYADLGRLYRLPRAVLDSAAVCRKVVLPTCLDLFPGVRCATFRTDIDFTDLDDLMRYYDACAPYCRPERRKAARAFFARRFARNGSYRISKRTIGIVGQLTG